MSYKNALSYNFHIPTKIAYRNGRLNEIPKEMEAQGIQAMASAVAERAVEDPRETLPVLLAAW